MTDETTTDDMAAVISAMQMPTFTTIHEMREWATSMEGVFATELPDVGEFHEAVLLREVDGERVVVDVVVPKGDGPFPVLVYVHGGGWFMGSLESYRLLAHRFAEAGFLVVNVGYRLAPEFPFPAGFDDCVEAIRWAARRAVDYGGDGTRLAVAGDSAGANLVAAAAAALADDPDAPEVRAALLMYGVYDFRTMPRGPNPESWLLLDDIKRSYLGDDVDRLDRDPRVSPLFVADKLPPSFVVVGETDELSEQAGQLAAALAANGIDHEHVVVPDMPHGFVQMEVFPQARETIDRMAAFLADRLGE